MTKDSSLQKFMVLIGIPGSGKSTAINMITSAVGEENVSCITLQDLNERFTPTELLGRLVNACADLPKKAMEQVDAIKRITGEDLIKGEYKGGKVFSFRSYAKLIFSANEMPRTLDEKSEAFFRRLLTIEIKQKGSRIPDLNKGLEYSMPGFIHKCVDSLNKLFTSGKEIDSPNSKALVHELYRESDSVISFLDDCVEFTPGKKIKRDELYRKYDAYCFVAGWTPLTNRGFYKNLRGKGIIDYMSHGDRYFRNMCPKSAPMCSNGADNGAGTETKNTVIPMKSS